MAAWTCPTMARPTTKTTGKRGPLGGLTGRLVAQVAAGLPPDARCRFEGEEGE